MNKPWNHYDIMLSSGEVEGVKTLIFVRDSKYVKLEWKNDTWIALVATWLRPDIPLNKTKYVGFSLINSIEALELLKVLKELKCLEFEPVDEAIEAAEKFIMLEETCHTNT